jgi:hypothetical protein
VLRFGLGARPGDLAAAAGDARAWLMEQIKGAVFGVAGTLENEAIRPNLERRFVDLLTAVEQHPAMIAFLDNQYSVDKDSDLARLAARHAGARPDKPKREFGINQARGSRPCQRRGPHGGQFDAKRRGSRSGGHRSQRLGYARQPGRRQGSACATANGSRPKRCAHSRMSWGPCGRKPQYSS